MKQRYIVIVGNVGTVYHGGNEEKANEIFNEYERQSETDRGRAGGENVTLLENGEIRREHFGSRLSEEKFLFD